MQFTVQIVEQGVFDDFEGKILISPKSIATDKLAGDCENVSKNDMNFEIQIKAGETFEDSLSSVKTS